MLKTLQTVGWSLLSPQPLDLHGPVVGLLGVNGSGKSSALDALKAVLGTRRFGQGRSPSSYRFAGRAGSPAAQAAYVLVLVANRRPDGTLRLPGRADELTLILEVGASQRRFLALDGNQLLDCSALDAEVAALRADRPRSMWMRPSEYESKVLDPLGFGPAVRRLHELPQGDIQRALDREPRALVGLLVELSGGRDAADRFAAAQTALTEAKSAHAEARRRHDRRRADLAERQLAGERGRQDQALRDRLSQMRADIAATLAAHPPAPAAEPRAPARRGVVNLSRLRAAGVNLAVRDGLWCIDPSDRELAAQTLGPGESVPVDDEGLAFFLHRGALVVGPAAQAQSDASEEVEPAAPALTERLRTALNTAAADLEAEGVGPAADGQVREGGELLGAYRALTAEGIPSAPDPGAAQTLEEMATALAADADELTRRHELLEDAHASLGEARRRYDQAVWSSLQQAAERFRTLCADGGLAGKMELADSPEGARVQIYAAEAAGEELRPLHGAQASLSGGWRASVVVLCLLAAVQSGALGALLLDEVAASLDEQRLVALGHAFASLGQTRDLLTVMSIPSKAMSESVSAFARQQVGFVRPRADEPLAPPPHVVVAPAAAAA